MMHHHESFWTGCGPHARAAWEEAAPWIAAASGFFGAAAFGVRRPLRFLAFQLGLDETQTREVARILDELKTERAQASVDHRRMSAALADVLAEDSFDATRAAEARSEEHTSELQSHSDLVCRLLLEKKKEPKYLHTSRSGRGQ